MKRFITQITDLSLWQPNGEFPVPQDVAHHVFHVMRMNVGDTLEFMDSAGNLVSAKITRDENVVCMTRTTVQREANAIDVSLGVALFKWPRFEWMLEKVAEVGVTSITPLCCERSVIKIQDWTHKSDRLQKIIAEAARQSLNPQPPHLETPKTVREFVANTDKQRTFFAHIGNYPRPSQLIPNLKGEIRFLIGPEGGFSPTETDFLLEHASPISLGHNILRAETAAIACAMTHLLCS